MNMLLFFSCHLYYLPIPTSMWGHVLKQTPTASSAPLYTSLPTAPTGALDLLFCVMHTFSLKDTGPSFHPHVAENLGEDPPFFDSPPHSTVLASMIIGLLVYCSKNNMAANMLNKLFYKSYRGTKSRFYTAIKVTTRQPKKRIAKVQQPQDSAGKYCGRKMPHHYFPGDTDRSY